MSEFIKLIKIIYTLLFIPIYLIIKIFSPFIFLRWSQLQTARVGGLTMETYIYYNYRQSKIKNNIKLIDIFYPEKIISNKFLFNLSKKKLIIFPRNLMIPLEKIDLFFCKFFPFFRSHRFNLTDIRFKNRHLINENKKFLSLKSSQILNKGNRILQKLGIPINKKYVCLIVRDDEYLEKKFPKFNWKYHEYRNSDIEKFIPAIKKLTSKGIYVLRMGSKTKKKLDLNDDLFIDYSNSDQQSDFMDVFLFSSCYFTITTGTGIDTISYVSNKPMVYIGLVPLKGFQYSGRKIISLTKDHYDEKKSKLMTLKEIFKCGIWKADKSQSFKEKFITLKENKPSDILDAVNEMIEKLENKWKPTDEINKLQIKFKETFSKNIKHLFEDDFKITSEYSSNYLIKNKWWLE